MVSPTRSLLVVVAVATLVATPVRAQNLQDIVSELFGDFPRVAPGFGFTSAIIPLESTLFNWGNSYPNAEAVYGGVQFAAIDASPNYQCGLRRDDMSLLCWGGGNEVSRAPIGDHFLRLSTGQGHACGLAFDETLVDVSTATLRDDTDAGRRAFFASIVPQCWGSALSSTNDANLQVPNIGTTDDPLVSIHAGRSYTCVRTFSGRVGCSGIFAGALGASETEASSVTPTTLFRTISSGESHVCGISTAGAMECFGGCSGVSGECEPPSGETWMGDEGTVASGRQYTCALNEGGTPICWGSETLFQSWVATSHPTPTNVTFSELHGGRFHLCGIIQSPTDASLAGNVQCWGQCAFSECDLPEDNPINTNGVKCTRRAATTRNCLRTTSETDVCELRTCGNGFIWSLDGGCDCDMREAPRYVATTQINGTTGGTGFYNCVRDGRRFIVTPQDPNCTA